MATPRNYDTAVCGEEIEPGPYQEWLQAIEAAKEEARPGSRLLVLTIWASVEIYLFDGQEWLQEKSVNIISQVEKMVANYPGLEERAFVIEQ